MPQIFISYRRDDTEGQALHLSQGLRVRFGHERVYMDVTDLHAGADYRSAIERATNDCDVFLAVIGNDWLTCKNPGGTRRLDDAEDLVRLEVAAALRLKKLVVPVLVENASMPQAKDLPSDIAALAGRQSVELRHTHWDRDFDELVEGLASAPTGKKRRSFFLLPATVGAAALMAFLLWWSPWSPSRCAQACVLVADFSGPQDGPPYSLTNRVLRSLEQAARGEDFDIVPLNRIINQKQGSAVARKEGTKRNARMVIWGWYDVTTSTVDVHATFEVLTPPKYMPALGPVPQSGARTHDVTELDWTVDRSELESVSLQPRLARQLTYFTLVTVGMIRYGADDWEGAIQKFSRALDQLAGQAPTVDQSVVYYKRGLSYGAQGDRVRARADYDRSIEINPTYLDAYLGRGVQHLQQGAFDSALTDFDQAITLDSSNALAYNNRAAAYLGKKEFQRAIDNYSRAVRLKSDPSFYRGRARAYLANQQYTLAIVDYDSALTLTPDESVYYAEGGFDAAQALYERGGIYSAKRDYANAIADYGRAIKRKPDFYLAFHDRGLAHGARGNYARAIDDYTLAIQLKPNDFSAYNNRGNAYVNQGKLKLALADFDIAVRLDSSNAVVYSNRGSAYLERDYARAVADFTRATTIDSNYVLAYHNRGLAYLGKGELDRAITDFDRAIRLAPADPLPYYDRGRAYEGKGDYARAITDYDEALRLKPDYALARENRRRAALHATPD